MSNEHVMGVAASIRPVDFSPAGPTTPRLRRALTQRIVNNRRVCGCAAGCCLQTQASKGGNMAASFIRFKKAARVGPAPLPQPQPTQRLLLLRGNDSTFCKSVRKRFFRWSARCSSIFAAMEAIFSAIDSCRLGASRSCLLPLHAYTLRSWKLCPGATSFSAMGHSRAAAAACFLRSASCRRESAGRRQGLPPVATSTFDGSAAAGSIANFSTTVLPRTPAAARRAAAVQKCRTRWKGEQTRQGRHAHKHAVHDVYSQATLRLLHGPRTRERAQAPGASVTGT